MRAICQNRLRTFELPANFDDVLEWHTRGEIETDEFEQSAARRPVASVYLVREPVVTIVSGSNAREREGAPLTHCWIHVNFTDN